MATHYDSINDYINAFPIEVQTKLFELKSCILSVVPDATELFNYDIPAFALIKGGKREEQIMFAGYKKHIGFYPHPTTIAHFEHELKNYKTAKGSVQFQVNEALPKTLIMDMIRYRYNLITNQI
jgi:uncharacterized protein YdhG (YjbR/CyaY superfamily)